MYNIKHIHLTEKYDIKCFTFSKMYFHQGKVLIKPNTKRYEEARANITTNNDLFL